MPIHKKTLDAIARTYVRSMTSIRGRRVHRLLMREFTRFDHVLPAAAEDGSPALLALAEDGRAAVCRTDGRGPEVAITELASLQGAAVTMSYDFLKDSLPIVSCTISHPGLAGVGGALKISGTDLSKTDHGAMTEVRQRLGATNSQGRRT